jgi:hypothetical protein
MARKKKSGPDWAAQMRAEYAHIPILSMDELRALPEPDEHDAGIYFLWKADELQYIGKSTQISHRLYLQDQANRYGHLRANPMKRIPYDRATALVLDTGRIRRDGLADDLRAYERAYIATYQPPLNHIGQNPGT